MALQQRRMAARRLSCSSFAGWLDVAHHCLLQSLIQTYLRQELCVCMVRFSMSKCTYCLC